MDVNESSRMRLSVGDCNLLVNTGLVASLWRLAVCEWLSPGIAVPRGNFTQCFPDRLALVLNSQERRRVNYPSATCPSSLVATQGRDEPRTSRKQWLHPCLSFPDYNWHLSPNRGNCAQIVPQSVQTPTIFNRAKRQEGHFPNSTKEFSIWGKHLICCLYTISCISCQVKNNLLKANMNLIYMERAFYRTSKQEEDLSEKVLFFIIGSRLWGLSRFKESIIG